MNKDSILNCLEKEYWAGLEQIVLFGFGRQGKKAYSQLKKEFKIVAIIDNDINKQGKIIDDIEIVSIDVLLPIVRREGLKIIVATQESNYFAIKKQLVKMKLYEYRDFVSNQVFFSEWFFRYKNQIRIMKIDLPITWKCTLKCENCMVCLPYSQNRIDFSLFEIKKSLEMLFDKVDYVMDVDISGGEPFISNNLSAVITEIGEKYRDKIGYLGIITNGMIIPKEEVLFLMKKYEVGVSISDYTDQVNYTKKMEEVCSILEKYKIKYMKNKNIEWFDFGLKKNSYMYSGIKAYRHMQLCRSVCHILYNQKVYYCSVDYGAQISGVIEEDKNSYVDLRYINTTGDQMRVLRFLMGGMSESEMPRACMQCGGFGVDNNRRVIAAEQLG